MHQVWAEQISNDWLMITTWSVGQSLLF